MFPGCMDWPEFWVECGCCGFDLDASCGQWAAIGADVEELHRQLASLLCPHPSLALVDDELHLKVGQQLQVLLLLEKEEKYASSSRSAYYILISHISRKDTQMHLPHDFWDWHFQDDLHNTLFYSINSEFEPWNFHWGTAHHPDKLIKLIYKHQQNNYGCVSSQKLFPDRVM